MFPLGVSGTYYLSLSLANKHNLLSLSANKCSIGSNLEVLTDQLKILKGLTSLSLLENEIELEQVKFLCEVVTMTKSLRKFKFDFSQKFFKPNYYLENDHRTHEQLVTSFSANKTIEKLKIGDCKFNKELAFSNSIEK